MTAGPTLLPPVIDQSLQRVPVDPWSALAFACVVGASAFLAYRRSPLVVALLAFCVPFAIYRDIGQTTLTLEKCVAVGVVGGLLAGGAPLLPASRPARRLMAAIACMLAAIALSGLAATYPWPVLREFFKQAEYLVLLWCAATFIERIPRSSAYLTAGVAISAAIVTGVALAQAVAGGAPSGMWVNGHALPRVAGTLEGPNQLAGYLEAALPLFWIWPAVARSWAPLREWLTGASSAALILTQSRAGILVSWLAFALSWRYRRDKASHVLVPMLAGAAAGLAVTIAWFAWAHARWSDIAGLFLMDIPGEPGGVGTRAQLWPAALAMFVHHPLVGVGAGNFELLLPAAGVAGVQTHAASLVLQTLAEQGAIGFGAFALFAIVALRETYAARMRSDLALVALLALSALLAHQLVDDLFFFPKAAALCWLLLGAGTADAASAGEMRGARAAA